MALKNAAPPSAIREVTWSESTLLSLLLVLLAAAEVYLFVKLYELASASQPMDPLALLHELAGV